MRWPLGLALTRGVVVAGGLDKGPLFLLSVLLVPTREWCQQGSVPGPRRKTGGWCAAGVTSRLEESTHRGVAGR